MGKKGCFDKNWSNHESFICTFIRFSCEQVDPSGRMARVIWNSRSKLSRWSVLEIDVMSARTRQDTGLYYAYEHVSRTICFRFSLRSRNSFKAMIFSFPTKISNMSNILMRQLTIFNTNKEFKISMYYLFLHSLILIIFYSLWNVSKHCVLNFKIQ